MPSADLAMASGARLLGSEVRLPQRRYQFHCVGEGDAVFDSVGRRLPTMALVKAQADRVAVALMERTDADWTRWVVDVRDVKGRQVLVRAFTDAGATGRGTAMP